MPMQTECAPARDSAFDPSSHLVILDRNDNCMHACMHCNNDTKQKQKREGKTKAAEQKQKTNS
jgi:MoaA/NifB/PqqE/SkfB family radical SAM enzyme